MQGTQAGWSILVLMGGALVLLVMAFAIWLLVVWLQDRRNR